MSYGARIADAMRQGGIYVGGILKGEKPVDLPVVAPVKYELVIRFCTTRTSGDVRLESAKRSTADVVRLLSPYRDCEYAAVGN
jgi:hypothetical protein